MSLVLGFIAQRFAFELDLVAAVHDAGPVSHRRGSDSHLAPQSLYHSVVNKIRPIGDKIYPSNWIEFQDWFDTKDSHDDFTLFVARSFARDVWLTFVPPVRSNGYNVRAPAPFGSE